MHRILKPILIVLACAVGASWQASAQENSATAGAQQNLPDWYRRGLPSSGHAALEPLVGLWRVHMEIHATLGRTADEPPLVSDDIICKREWVAGGRYLEDTTEGTLEGAPYWRRGWLGYSNMDRRYEWVTIDATNATMMIYLGEPASGEEQPLNMTGVFTDQGVAGEAAVGKSVPMRTEITIESEDRHVFDLYFTPPGMTEVLAVRGVYTRLGE